MTDDTSACTGMLERLRADKPSAQTFLRTGLLALLAYVPIVLLFLWLGRQDGQCYEDAGPALLTMSVLWIGYVYAWFFSTNSSLINRIETYLIVCKAMSERDRTEYFRALYTEFIRG